MSMHDGMCNNPLDMSATKYQPPRVASAQRDMNPLGQPLRKDTRFHRDNLKSQAEDLLTGKKGAVQEASRQALDAFNKYKK